MIVGSPVVTGDAPMTAYAATRSPQRRVFRPKARTPMIESDAGVMLGAEIWIACNLASGLVFSGGKPFSPCHPSASAKE